jgi:hypothetical protein
MIGVFMVGMLVGFLGGLFFEARLSLRMWQTHHYCPICDRLACEQEHS